MCAACMLLVICVLVGYKACWLFSNEEGLHTKMDGAGSQRLQMEAVAAVLSCSTANTAMAAILPVHAQKAVHDCAESCTRLPEFILAERACSILRSER